MIRSSPSWMVAFGARCARESVAAAVIAILGFAVPVPATAVTLGPITQQSGLGQSLRVVVPVSLSQGEELPADCFKIASGQGAADGVPDLLFGRISVERTPAGTTLVVTSPRAVMDPVVRLTIQAGCETSMRREYTLFMDPPAIDAPVVAAAQPPSAREVLGLPPSTPTPAPTAREARRPPPKAPARTGARSGQAGVAAADAEAPSKGPPPKGRAAPRTVPPPPSATAASQPRLSVSSGAPGTLPGTLATEADRERARQERANAIDAETQVLRQRIVELTAMVERMQQDLRAQEAAEQAAASQAAKAAAAGAAAPAKAPAEASATPADAAKAPESIAKPPVPATASPSSADAAKPAAQDVAPVVEPAKTPPPDATKASATPKGEPPVLAPSWWEQNALLISAIVGLPLLIAAALLWKRRRDAQDDSWRTHTASIPLGRSTSQLRGAPAGLTLSGRTMPPAMNREMASPLTPRDAVDALAVSELSHVTEEARVFMTLGHNDRAIEVLQDHIRRLPRSMPAAWLMLLDLYHQEGNRAEFRKLADTFHTHCNVRAPLWEEFTGENSLAGGIEAFPAIERQVVALWRKPECRPYLEGLLYDNREGRRNGFPLTTYSDILLLLQVLDAPVEVDIDEDLVAAGKLEGRPRAKAEATAAARRPMPPDPAASRPAQQPIRFEIEPPDPNARKKN